MFVKKVFVIILFVVAVFFGCSGKRKEGLNQTTVPEIEVSGSTKTSVIFETESVIYEVETSLVPDDFSVTGITDEVLKEIGFSRERLADAVYSWARKNGYVSASGVYVSEDMTVRYTDMRYSFDGVLYLSSGGNGVYASDEVVVVIECFGNGGEIYVHQ